MTSCDSKTIDRSAFEKTLVCVGRQPLTQGLGLEDVGVDIAQNGACRVDDSMKTNIPSIYAAGDCTARIMLAHYAAFQGRRAVRAIAGIIKPITANYGPVVPACVFTDPEVASVGLTEDKARRLNIKIHTYRFDFMASGMARIRDEADGFAKVIAEETTGRVVGGSIIGPQATELISILATAVQAAMTVEQLGDTILPHPSLSEALTEALRNG